MRGIFWLKSEIDCFTSGLVLARLRSFCLLDGWALDFAVFLFLGLLCQLPAPFNSSFTKLEKLSVLHH